MSLEAGILGFRLRGREMETEPQGWILDLRGIGVMEKLRGRNFSYVNDV